MNDPALILKKETERTYAVLCDGTSLGSVELYANPFHSRNQYLRLHLSSYDTAWAAPLFSLIQDTVHRPLQVMLSSEDTGQADFLIAGGFECKRKCYELEVTAQDCSVSNTAVPLEHIRQGEPDYLICCQLLYDHYRESHTLINPFTAEFSSFCSNLPHEVFCERSDGQIRQFAFIEENEIAYVGSTDISGFRTFAEAVVTRLFGKYETICFECDDCDAAAMTLKSLFRVEVQESYDTYVRGCDRLDLHSYCADPCGTASLPYWKAVQTQIPDTMRIVHQSAFTGDLLAHYTDEPYFRLKHDLSHLIPPRLPEGFSVGEATCREYAGHISGCYSKIGITEDDLQGYTRRSVYCRELWLAVRDKNTGTIVATGIGELDRNIGEGVLEWIQVSPDYRGKGLGKFLVLELLRRMTPLANFATVSGQCSNPTNPEGLYRSCGFRGHDVWHILRRK